MFAGSTLAIGAPGLLVHFHSVDSDGLPNNRNTDVTGHVTIYRYSPADTTWTQIGQVLQGDATGDNFGFDVALTDDGNTVAVGSPRHGRGHAKVFTYGLGATSTDARWYPVGSDIDAKFDDISYGYAVDLKASGSGFILAIGGPTNYGFGVARAYRWSCTGSSWEQVGSTLRGQYDGDKFGRSLALSADGKTLAVGALLADSSNRPQNHAGFVDVFSLTGTQSIGEQWEPLGDPIVGTRMRHDF